MKLRINGKDEEIPEGGMNLEKLLEAKNVRPETVAVELNQTVVERKDYPSVVLADGDHLEIVKIIGGGA